jgi:glycosyltransferase involved in cell wall biosynthesis
VLFQAGNVESCVKALAWSTQNIAALKTMAIKAQRHVAENYSWEKITADNLRLYKATALPAQKPVLSQKLQ